MVTKIKEFFARTLGITLTTVLIVSGFTALTPTVATAETIVTTPPSKVTLKTENITASTTDLTVTVDKPLEDSGSVASLYKVNDPVTVDTADAGTSFVFTVNNPTLNYEQYYIMVGDIKSNTVTVNPNNSNSWSATLATVGDVSSFKTQESTPKLVWATNKPLINHALYLVDKDTGNIFKSFYDDSTTGKYAIPRFYTEDQKEYVAYVAHYSYSATNVSQLQQIQTVSNSLFISREKWTVKLTTNLPTFSTDDGSLYVNWELNQYVGSTNSKFRFYLTEQDTGKIITTGTGNYLTNEINIPKFITESSKSYVGYVAANSTGITNASQLTNIQATSNVLTITRAAWSLTLNTPTPIYDETENQILVNWRTNQTVRGGSNNYNLYIADKETGNILYRHSGIYTSNSEVYLPGLASAQKFKEFVGYVAYQTGSTAPKTIAELTGIQAVSNVLKVSRDSWEISIGTDKPIFTTSDTAPEITWVTNRPTGQQLKTYIGDDITGEIIGSGAETDTTGTVRIEKFRTGAPRTYTAYIADTITPTPEKVTELTNIQATSNTITIARAAWDTTISIDNSVFKTDDERPTFTWNTNQKVGTPDSGYHFYLVDETTGKIIDKATGYEVESWENGGTIRLPKFYTGGTHEYRGYIAKATNYSNAPTTKNELEEIQTISNTVTATRYVWQISLGIDKTIFSTNDSTPRLTWRTNQSVAQSQGAYAVYIFDTTTGALIENTSDSSPNKNDTVSVERFYKGDAHTYVAYVAASNSMLADESELEDIQAVSNTTATQRAQWGIGLQYEITSVNKYNETKYIEFNWVTNQNVDNTNNNYKLYVFNKTNGSLIGTANYTGSKGQIAKTVDLNSKMVYIAYIAKDADIEHISELEDIQAVSEAVFPNETSTTIEAEEFRGGGNPSKADCNQQCYGDPVNSYNGEFFENTTDLTINNILPFNFTRSYSIYNADSLNSLGNGWTHNYEMNLKGDSTSLNASDFIEVFQENSSSITFAKTTIGNETVYVGSNNIQASFKYDASANKYILNRNNGYEYVFNANGVLEQLRDLNNNTLTLNYTAEKLTSIVSSQGATLTIQWSGNKIVSITDGNRTVIYDYSPENNLSIVDLPDTIGHKQYVYDGYNRITKIIAQNGGFYLNEYNEDNQVIKQTNPLGGETVFSYGEDMWTKDRITSITLPDSTIVKEEYNSFGQLSKKTLAVGTSNEAAYEYKYDFSGQVSEEKDPVGNITKYTHDNKGNVASVTNAANKTTYFTYNALNKLVEITNSKGNKAFNEYDEKGNLVKTVSFEGNVTKYEVNPNGTNNKIVAPNDYVNNTNNHVSFGYDNNGFLNTTTNPEGGVLNITNNSIGNPLTVTDPLNNTTQYTYNAQNQLVETLAANGAATETEYDNAGQVVKTVDELDNETLITYDLMGNVKTVTTPLGTQTYHYDNMQRVIKVTAINGGETIQEYDKLGRVVKTIDPLGNETTTSYTKHSLVESVTDPRGNTTNYEYDNVGNTTKIIDPLGNESTATYDALNRLISTTSANGYTETYTYDDDSNLISTTKAGLETTTYEYDNNSNLVKTIYPDSSTEQRTYNSDNELLTLKNRDDKTTSYVYNAGGQVVKTIRPDNSEVVYSYTNRGDLDSVSYDNWATIDTEFVYNTAGQLTNEFKNGVETTYSYDQIGNLTKRGPPTGSSVQYDYNTYGQLKQTTYPNGLTLDYTYDLNSNLKKVKNGTSVLAEYIYDSNGNNTRVNYGNGTFEENSYDKLSRLKQFTVNNNTNQLYKKELELNTVGLIVGNKTTNETTVTENKTYSYTANQRLQSVTDSVTSQSDTYDYDTSHNLVSSPLGVNTFTANGQINSTVKTDYTTSYAHDLRGNRTNKTVTNSNDSNIHETVNYSWTNDNKLSNFTLTNTADNSKNRDISYSYDATGLVKQKTDNLTNHSNHYVWDTLGGIPTLLEDSDNSYLYGLGSAPFAQINKTSNQITYLHGDERGSIILATDNAGSKEWSRSYDEYGSTYTQTPSTGVVTPFAYAGEYLDEDTELYNLRARWYEPGTASFLSIDPALSATGEAYSYASGNPLSFTDPLGLWSVQNSINALSGFLDGVTGIPIASTVGNFLVPGSIQTCSPEYSAGNFIGNAASMFIPGFGQIKSIAILSSLALKVGIAAGIKEGVQLASVVAIPAIIKKNPTPRWKVGDWIGQPINGKDPSWGVIRSRYWKNEAHIAKQNPGQLTPNQIARNNAIKGNINERWTRVWSEEQIKRMESGRAPQRFHPEHKFRESMELSHETTAQRDAKDIYDRIDVVQRWAEEHALVDTKRHLGPKYKK